MFRIVSNSSAQRIFLIGRLILTVLVVVYVFRRFDVPTAFAALKVPHPLGLAAAVACQGCAIALAASRWRILLANQRIQLGWARTARLTLVGLFFNLLFLGGVGGDAARFVGALGPAAERRARLVLSLVQDRLIGVGALLLLASGCMGANTRLLWGTMPIRPLIVGVLFAAAVFLTLAVLAKRAESAGGGIDGLPESKRRIDARVIGALFPGRVLGRAIGLSLGIHSLVITGGYLAAHAVGIDLALPAAGVVLGLTSIALSVPITMAGLGVRDGMLVWLLPVFGFHSAATAIRLSTCLLGIGLCWALVGAVCAAVPYGGATGSRERNANDRSGTWRKENI